MSIRCGKIFSTYFACVNRPSAVLLGGKLLGLSFLFVSTTIAEVTFRSLPNFISGSHVTENSLLRACKLLFDIHKYKILQNIEKADKFRRNFHGLMGMGAYWWSKSHLKVLHEYKDYTFGMRILPPLDSKFFLINLNFLLLCNTTDMVR